MQGLQLKQIVHIRAGDKIKVIINTETPTAEEKKDRTTAGAQRQQCIDSEQRTVNDERDDKRRGDMRSTIQRGESMTRQTYFAPTHPRTSTREKAVVGVAGAIKDWGRPRDPLLNKRGIFMLGNARVFTLGVRIIVEGAALGRALGEGGKTNNVCDGVGSGWEGGVGLGGVLREGSSAGAEIRGSG